MSRYVLRVTSKGKAVNNVGYWTGVRWDTDIGKALRQSYKNDFEIILKSLSVTLPHAWELSVIPAWDEVKKNPVPRSKYAKIKESIERFKLFTGMEPEHLDEYLVTHPDVAFSIGTLDGVLYTTKREGKIERYKHEFTENARPLLCSSHDGKQLVILGGDYHFTERGIVDGV